MKYSTWDKQMKAFEADADIRLDPSSVHIVRVDGRNFHGWTRDLPKPWCEDLHAIFVHATLATAKELSARVAYTQSDEASFFLPPTPERLYSGRVQKLASVSASLFTGHFLTEAKRRERLQSRLPVFDARAYEVPHAEDALHVLRWRMHDAQRGSLHGFARSVLGHDVVQTMNAPRMIDALREHGTPWEELPEERRVGRAWRAVKVIGKEGDVTKYTTYRQLREDEIDVTIFEEEKV